MNTRRRGLVASMLMATLVVSPLVDAKRVGGGRSHGMTRSAAPSQSYQQAPSYQTAPAATYNRSTQQKSGSGVGKMVAAGAAGAAVGAIAANAMADDRHSATANTNTATEQTDQQQAQQKEKSGVSSWIWIVLLGGIAFFIFRRMEAKKKLASNNPYAPNAGGNGPFAQPPVNARNSNDNTNIFGQSVGGNSQTAPQAPFGGAAYTNSGSQLPDGSEPAAFLRIARQRFNHIQSINSASNVEEIRRYLTPELYQSIYQDIMSNQDQDIAEFSNLNAMIVESTTENGQYIASVRFTGSVSEDLNSQPKPFSEIWHFVKPANTQQDWVVAGIQVES
ncbi:Tim44-like domain-containing protein [Acinetobacter sp. MD2(2019)]|uniref:Tim44 domain-containing protein n=1 Tax=Acinetobacter sp. MD2(2019) TaxID=2605273 RepID=UPI002D1E596C|nr:Tim44-like domain-containing protein [Acinetobacter sp. MD2(2019)]MEB3754006.1 Tim44 domain-containing protein [Acinetobacter sp. MD2(2019)]